MNYMVQIKNIWKFSKTLVNILLIKVLNFQGRISINGRSVIPFGTIASVEKNSFLSIQKHVNVRKGCKISVHEEGQLKIEEGVSFNYNCIITAYNKILIGEGTIIGSNVCIYDHDHEFGKGVNIHEGKYKMDSVIIGKNVWIGANTVLLRGTNIGDNCVIAAGSIVKGEMESNTLLIQKRKNEYKKIEEI